MSHPTPSPVAERPRAAPAAIRVRLARRADRAAIASIGHPPDVARTLCPGLAARIAWRLAGIRVRSVIAEDDGAPLGCVQFVGSRPETGTWMFGHWRVAAPRRRAGIGRRLLQEGVRLLPAVRRLYSYVDLGNEGSMRAHERLGFEAAAEIQGSAPLAPLATIGPPAPPARLVPAAGADADRIEAIYRRAMGSLWFRLFPAEGRTFSERIGGGIEGPPDLLRRAIVRGRARVFLLESAGEPAGVVVVRARFEAATLYADPARCDAALLARAAARLLAMGAPRDLSLSLCGLGRALAAGPGPIAARVLMGLPDMRRLLG